DRIENGALEQQEHDQEHPGERGHPQAQHFAPVHREKAGHGGAPASGCSVSAANTSSSELLPGPSARTPSPACAQAATRRSATARSSASSSSSIVTRTRSGAASPSRSERV